MGNSFHKVGKGYHSADGPDIVRVLWHPLGVEGASLIVLTSDGFVRFDVSVFLLPTCCSWAIRTYDFTIGNDLSFALPDQTLDLLTLGGKKRCTGGFTADEDEMEPASCCFGAGEQGWRPFTLYILMRGGDIYALSPIVPSRWMATGDYLRNLSMNTAAELEDLNSDASWLKRAAIRSQTKWVNHVLDQESKLANRYPILTSSPRQSNPTCLARPDVVESNPILQGPFLLQPEPERFPGDDTTHAACDIFHIEGGSVGLLGVVYSHGKVEICLECEPLTARWVDKKKGSSTPEEIPDLPVISCYEVVDLGFNVGSESAHTNWPVFSSDPHSEATWYVNHRGGVTSLSMQQWVSQLGTVLDDEEEDYKFISKILNKTPTMVQSIIVSETPSSTNAVVGSAAVYSAYIGYVFIAISCSDVFSVEFEWPSGVADTTSEDGKTTTLNTTGCEFRTLRADGQSTLNAVDSAPSLLSHSPAAHSMAEKLSVLQPPYSVSPEFSVLSSLPSLLQQVKMRYPQIMAGSIILSAESNTVLRAARDTLKSEFDQVMAAAQEMYDRAAAQRLEYEKQLETISTVNRRLANLKEKNVRERLDNYTVQQEKLQAKADELLRIMVIKNVKGLSDAEKKWSQEVARVHERLNGEGRTSLTRRKSEVKDMLIELCTETKDDDMRLSNEEQIDGVPTEVRRRKLRQLRQLLDRE